MVTVSVGPKWRSVFVHRRSMMAPKSLNSLDYFVLDSTMSQLMGYSWSFGRLRLLKLRPPWQEPMHHFAGDAAAVDDVLLPPPIRTDVLNYLKFHRTDGSDSMKAQLCNRLPRLPPNYLNNVLELVAAVVNRTPSNADDNIDHNWTYNSGNAFHLLLADAVAGDDANGGGGDNLVTDLPNNRHDCMSLVLVVAADLTLSLDHHRWLGLLLLPMHLRLRTMMPMRMPWIVESAADYHLNRLQPLRADYDDDFGYALVMMHYFQTEHHTHYKNCSCCCCCCCSYCWRYWRCWNRRQCPGHYYWCYFHVAQTTEEPMQPHSVFLRVPLFSTAPHTKIALLSSLLLRRFAHGFNIKNKNQINVCQSI